MELQLYMWSGTRALILERHDFFVDQFRARVLTQFGDLEGDADRFMASEFDRLRRTYDDGTRDEADAADAATAQGEGFYSLLSDLREAMVLGGLAGLYHQWEKDLRDFLERELLHYVDRDAAIKEAWSGDIGKVFKLLKEFAWDVRGEPFFAEADACRVIVNVYKHGKGNSLTELAEKYPEFLAKPFVSPRPWRAEEFLDHEWLQVTAEQFDRLAASLRAFWVAFPERSFLKAE